MRFLSPEWVSALDEAARRSTVRTAAPDLRLVVQQTVTGDDVRYRIVVDHDGARVEAGAGESTVTLTTDAATARAIARGELPAQRAFMEGRLRLGGDVTALVAHQSLLAELDEALAPVRQATAW